jgi:hypothetical protein
MNKRQVFSSGGRNSVHNTCKKTCKTKGSQNAKLLGRIGRAVEQPSEAREIVVAVEQPGHIQRKTRGVVGVGGA